MISLSQTDPSSRQPGAAALAVAACLVLAVSIAGCSSGEGNGSSASAKSAATVTVTTPSGATTTATTATTGAPAGTTSSTPSTTPSQSQPTTSQTPPAATASAVVEGNAICARRGAEVAALDAAVTSSDPSKAAAGVARLAAVERRALGELRALAPPAGTTADWHALLEYGEVRLRRTTALAGSGHVNARQSLSLLIAATPLRVLAAAAHAGLKECYLRSTAAAK